MSFSVAGPVRTQHTKNRTESEDTKQAGGCGSPRSLSVLLKRQ